MQQRENRNEVFEMMPKEEKFSENSIDEDAESRLFYRRLKLP